MPKRIPFHVVYATSEDSSYPACELNNQGPAARGWRSSGPPPHELLIRLTSITRVHKLQLLAHHQLIPSWVEVLVSGGLMSEGAATPCGATYTSVGRVELAPPGAQAATRELRSAALAEPTVARFVKLRMSGPHPPAGNWDQVALMAVNVLGEVLEEDDGGTPVFKSDTFSPYDDLSFVMYVDNEIADLIRLLDEKKKIAVVEERFEYARRLKSAGSALTTAGARIGRWRLRKRTAAVRDDFELARRMRDRISDALDSIKEDVDLCRLMEEYGPDPKNDSSMPQEYDFSHHLSPSVLPGSFSMEVNSPVPPIEPEPRDTHLEEVDGPEAGEVTCVEDKQEIVKSPVQAQLDQVYNNVVQEDKIEITKKIEEEELRRETDSPRRSVTPNNGNGVLVRRRNKSAGPRTTFEAYEDRPLPTLRHSHTNEYLKDTRDDEGSAAGSTSSHQRPPHKMNEKERKQAALPILIFGEPLVEKFYSKTFIDKEDGLTRLKSELTSPSNGSGKTSPNKTARAAAALLQRSIRDKVFSVYCQANELVKVLFLEFMPERVCAAEVGRCLEKLLPELLRASGDPAPRIHSMAQHTVLTIADCPHVRSLHIIPQQLVRPVAASIHPRLALSRLQMLEQLVLNHGISTEKNSGLTVRRLAECGAAGAQHASGAVRAAAERILVTVYKRSPRVVRAQLPPDDAVTRRNLIYRHLFQQFDKIDMQKVLSQAPLEDVPQEDQTDPLDSISISQSCRSTTISGMTSSIGMTSSYSLKSLASSVSGATLAPSSFSGSSTKTKSSLKKVPLRKYTPGKGSSRDLSMGFNKLRLDSAVSPKHSPRSSISGGEKVHFEDTIKKDVVMRRSNRNSENRHSMIHFDHEPSKPRLKERPTTVYESLHLSYTDSPTIESPRTSKMDLRMDSLSIDSPRELRSLDYRSMDSPKMRADYYNSSMDSPKTLPGLKNLNLDDTPMDESGYYSPGDTGRKQLVVRSKSGNVAEFGDSFETGGAADVSSDGTTPEPVCNTNCSWCGRRVRAGGLETHYWKRCVLLARCPHCQTAFEARTLHAHLLEECSLSGGSWKQCQKCGAALKIEDNNYHVNCIPLGLDEWKCPYCLTNVLARDLPWQRHLMQCPRNPRRNPQSFT